MPKDQLFVAAVCHAAADCFAAGDSLKGVAEVLDGGEWATQERERNPDRKGPAVTDMRVRRALERGRKAGAPAYLAKMAQAYDDYQEAAERELAGRRAALAAAAGATG